MSDILNPEAFRFFFGPLFRIDVAMTAMSGHHDLESLNDELVSSIAEGDMHLGLQLVGYENVDTGFSAAFLMRNTDSPSMVSFFAESHHRLFGGSTLVCVPFAFVSSYYEPHGDYLVYRHTYKRPNFEPDECKKIMQSGTDHEKAKAFIYTKLRNGYTTIPGMSYVGITKRSWQTRYLEHVENAMEKSSSTRFHDAIRKMQGQNVVHVHDISAYGVSEQEAKDYESKLIKKSTLWPIGLNMKA